MKTFADLIDAFGPGEMAAVLGISRSHVHTMRARNSIPPIYWGLLVDAAPVRGISDLTHAKCRELREGRLLTSSAA